MCGIIKWEVINQMKEVAKIKNYTIYEWWFRYYVYFKIEDIEYFDWKFEDLESAINYVKDSIL